MTESVENDARCWRSECRNGCYYPTVCSERPSVENDVLRKMLDDERAAKRIAADAADRFRDVLSECLGHPDENPGDDVLVTELRDHFGKTGPEPTRWRDFCSGALVMVDQINAERRVLPPTPPTPAPTQRVGE